MNHQQLIDVMIRSVFPAKRKPMLWSPPGMGKTDLFGQLVARLTRSTDIEWGLKIWDMTYLYDPADSRGIPTIDTLADGTRVTRWVRPEHMVVGDQPTVILLDDLPTLPQTSQAAMLRLIQHGEIGGTTFGPNVFFCAAGNRTGDSSAANAMPFAFANRFTHFNLRYTLDGWVDWGFANNVPLPLITYHRFTRGENLYPIYNPSDSAVVECGLCKQNIQPGGICKHCIKRSPALPTLRTWGDGVARTMQTNPDPDTELELYAGDVGKEKAAEFKGYLDTFRSMASPESIIMGPMAAPIPAEPSAMYFVASALARIATPNNMDSVCQYLERLPHQEFAALTIKDAKRHCPDVEHTKPYQQWLIRHQNLLQ